ncbi:chaperone protein dnaj 1 [Fagus crenata]
MASLCYYSVLGLCKQATDDEIHCAYRELAMEWHPDNMKDPKDAGEAEGRFQQIQEAYSGIFEENTMEDLQGLLMDMMRDDEMVMSI